MPPITNALVPAGFRDAMLNFLRGVRFEVERARSVTTVATRAIVEQNTDHSEELATVLQDYVDDPLCLQVEKLDAMIECVEAQEVRHG